MQSYSSKYLLLLLVFAILVLLISIVGVSFALSYYDNTVTNKSIKTGYVFLNFDENKRILLSGEDCVSDEIGVNSTKYRKTFNIITDVDSVYDLGINRIDEDVSYYNYIKVALLDENNKVLIGNKDGFGNLESGIYLQSIKNKKGMYNLINNYALLSGTVTADSAPKSYTLIAYVSNVFDGIAKANDQKNKSIEIKMSLAAFQK